MRGRIAALSPRVLGAICAGGVLLVAVALWLLVVSPKRAEVTSLEEDLVAAELRLVEAQLAASRPEQAVLQVVDVLRLAKAMPESADQPGLVLELSRLASASGVSLRSITPQGPTTQPGGATTMPVSVTVTGTLRGIATFLQRMRLLVVVRDGELQATGRLLSVRSVDLVESVTDRFPRLDATVALDAYVYDGPIAPATPPPADDEEELPTESSATGGP